MCRVRPKDRRGFWEDARCAPTRRTGHAHRIHRDSQHAKDFRSIEAALLCSMAADPRGTAGMAIGQDHKVRIDLGRRVAGAAPGVAGDAPRILDSSVVRAADETGREEDWTSVWAADGWMRRRRRCS